MYLEIVTPDRKVFEGEVSAATFPGTNGAFQVLSNHAPLISTLAKGPLKYIVNDKESIIIVDGGVVEVLENKIIVLAEAVEDAE
ncbi:ATP synthase F1 subunit epsilon [Persicobacter psychrovividus]|uniref:ATP synthase F1 subunit epsilon n=1 Tax=Persicobacter psychrovividus TaxID=387638 RepID=UPI002FCE0A36